MNSSNAPLRWFLARWHWGLLLLVCAAWFAGLNEFAARYNPDGISDEWDVIGPALKAMSGEIPDSIKYPYFSYYFFGLFFAAAGTLGDPAASLAIARVINALLFGVNLLLMYHFARALYSRPWALLATFIFSTLPWVIVSGAVVKTEALLLCEVLLTLVALQKITGKKAELRWHALAGFSAGAAVGTKLNIFPVTLYAFHMLYLLYGDYVSRENSGRRLLQSVGALPLRSLFLFAVLSLSTLWAGLPPADRVGLTLEIIRNDPYLLPGAGPIKAVAEWDAFPYDQFTSYVTTTLPLSLGLFVFFVAGSFILRALSKWELRVFGVATLVTLVFGLLGTRLRTGHSFVYLVPFFVLASVAFLKRCAELIRNKALRIVLAILLAVLCLGQWAYYATRLPKFAENMGRLHNLWVSSASAGEEGRGSILVLMFADDIPPSHRDANGEELKITFQQRLQAEQPRYLMIYNPYFINMCKYKRNEVYRENCAFYQELLNDKTDYRLVDSFDLDFGKALAVDPEIREMAIYFFEKR